LLGIFFTKKSAKKNRGGARVARAPPRRWRTDNGAPELIPKPALGLSQKTTLPENEL
jgi:hypothetical protein